MLFLVAVISAGAQERIFKEYNFAITPPPGWEEMSNVHDFPEVIDSFRSPERMRLMMLMVKGGPNTGTTINERFVADFEVAQEGKGNGKAQSRRYIDVGGERAYERVSQIQVKGKPVSIMTRVLVADHKGYAMQGLRYEGEITNDDEIKASMASFRFLEPPKHQFFNPDDQTAAVRLALLKRKYTPLVVFIAGLAAVIIIVIQQRKKRHAKPPPLPPV